MSSYDTGKGPLHVWRVKTGLGIFYIVKSLKEPERYDYIDESDMKVTDIARELAEGDSELMPIDYRQIENLPTFEDYSLFLLNDIRRKLKDREIKLTKLEEKWKLEKGSPAPSYFFGDAKEKVVRLQAAVEAAAVAAKMKANRESALAAERAAAEAERAAAEAEAATERLKEKESPRYGSISRDTPRSANVKNTNNSYGLQGLERSTKVDPNISSWRRREVDERGAQGIFDRMEPRKKGWLWGGRARKFSRKSIMAKLSCSRCTRSCKTMGSMMKHLKTAHGMTKTAARACCKRAMKAATRKAKGSRKAKKGTRRTRRR